MKSLRPTLLVIMLTCWTVPAVSWSAQLPDSILLNLSSEDFRKRESAQDELLVWARDQREPAIEELFRQTRLAGNPEVRERCMDVLRELINEDYLRDGKGYVGIRMQDEIAKIPGDPKPRSVIRVTLVMPDSAAELAGLQVNDLIAGLADQVWYQGLASMPFGEKVRDMKPETKIKLKILRNGNLMDFEVKLGRRPLYADNLFFEGSLEDLDEVERQARDAYFLNWLKQKRKGNENNPDFGNRHP